ncbi:MAG TPA: TonB-dependent receptor [Steroidobacteraceae bacterium]|jgi:outer membrane receptor protein involved in Fe transport|nr:TonB-dependent receptor [Steroidobacteraceae bacterium]
MGTNRISGKSARSVPRPPDTGGDIVTAPSPYCSALRSRDVRARSVAAVVAGILGAATLTAAPAYAQTAPATQAAAASPQSAPTTGSAQTSQSLQEVVVTATAARTTKLDASYNVVTADDELIKESNPLSAADILKIAPGVWPESSGGETGLNVEVAGFPSGGDTPFFTTMIMGMPVYGSPMLSYMDTASFIRLDDTVQRLEVVQGGPAAVFGPGQIGGTGNYILKTGDTSPGGTVSATYGTEGAWRGDAYDGFTIADGWYGSVGGFYRVSDGIRNSQFPADTGGQFTATLKHDLDGGSLTFWGRVLDDKDQYVTPIPLVENSNSSFSGYPGFNPLTATFNGYGNQVATLANNANDSFVTANLANGRSSQLYFLGADYDQHLGGWTLHNGFLIDGGGMDTNGWFSGQNPRPLSMYLYGCNVAEPAGWCNGSTPADKNNLNGGLGYDPATYNIQAQYAGSGAAVPLSANVITQSYHYIQKSIQSVTDEFRVSRDLFQGDTLTAGVYLADYTENDTWISDQALMTATPNASLITLSYTQSGNTYDLTSPQGFVNDNGTYNNPARHGDGRNIAPYLSDSWHDGPWLADVGARLENEDLHERACLTTTGMMGTIYDLWDNKVPVCNGGWDHEHYTHTMPSFTGGVNYEFSKNMSAYVRANSGNHLASLDDIVYAHVNAPYSFTPVETIRNYEVGVKFQTSFSYLDLSAYHRTFDGIRYQGTTLEGVAIPGEYGQYGALSNGVDLDGYVKVFKGFTVRVVGDYTTGHYDHDYACLPYTTILGNSACASINGAPLQRQPKFQVRVTPSYFAATAWGDVTTWLTYEHAGQRYSDIAGTQPLGTYNMLSGGVVTDIGNHWQFRVQGTNLTNTLALTEGNARVFGGAVGVGDVVLARPYEGREVNFTAGYNF